MWVVPDEMLAKIDIDGFYVGENIVSEAVLKRINDELAPWRNVPALNGYGCQIHSDDALIQNLALLSPTALKMAVDDSVLNVMEKVLKEPVLLGKIEYRRALVPKDEMPTHSDGNDDIGVFIYLSGVNPRLGPTALLPGTHRREKNRNKGYAPVSIQEEREAGISFVPVDGKPGVCLFFNGHIWHKRLETIQSGRELIWLTYTPLSRAKNCVELVFSRTALQSLSQRQRAALGFELTQTGKPAEDFNQSRKITPASLHFLSDGFLIQTLFFRAMRHIRAVIPRPVKRLIRRLITRAA